MLKKIPTIYLFLLLIIASIYSNFKYLSGKIPFFTKKEFQLKLPNLDYWENAKYLYKGKVKSVTTYVIETSRDYSSKKETYYDTNGNLIAQNLITFNGNNQWINTYNDKYKYNDKGLLEYSEEVSTSSYDKRPSRELKSYKYNEFGNISELDLGEDNVTKYEYEDYPDEHLVKVIKKDAANGYIIDINYYKYDDNNLFKEAYITEFGEHNGVFYSFNENGVYNSCENEGGLSKFDNEGNEILDVRFFCDIIYDNRVNQRIHYMKKNKYTNNHIVTETSNISWEEDYSSSKSILDFNNLRIYNWIYNYQSSNGKILSVEQLCNGEKSKLGNYKYDFHNNILFEPHRQTPYRTHNTTFTYYE